MKSCILISHMPNPRFLKRIAAIESVSEAMLICVRRKGSNLWDSFDSQGIRCEIIDLAMPDANKIIKRGLLTFRFEKFALKKMEDFDPDIVYLEGIDCLSIAGKYAKRRRNTRIYYEIGDLRTGITDKNIPAHRQFLNKWVTWSEKKLFKYIYKIVVTSMKFYDDYYKKFFDESRCLCLPNIPDLGAFDDYSKRKKDKFTIGFIGVVRYFEQMEMLIDATQGLNVNVFFAGGMHDREGMERLKKSAENRDDVMFLGPYNYENDIAGLYSLADCIYSVYDVSGKNARIALPNKLYESVICGLPIIVAEGTYLGKIVNEWNCGEIVNFDDTIGLRSAICRLMNKKNYNEIVRNCEEKSKEIKKIDTKNILANDIMLESKAKSYKNSVICL